MNCISGLLLLVFSCVLDGCVGVEEGSRCFEQGTVFRRGSLIKKWTRVETVESCSELCRGDLNCEVFTHHSGRAWCKLKKKRWGVNRSKGKRFTSGFRNCDCGTFRKSKRKCLKVDEFCNWQGGECVDILPTASPTFSPLDQKILDAPNILMIILDDWREAKYDVAETTPNLQKLRQDGVDFSMAFANFPQCGPSRNSFLTGRYPSKSAMLVSNLLPPEWRENPFMHKHFREQGYLTGTAGKVFHTRTSSVYPEGWFDVTDLDENPVMEVPFPFQVCKDKTKTCSCKEDMTKSGCRDFISAQKTIGWIGDFAKQSRPWFLTCGFVRPHTDFEVPDWIEAMDLEYEETELTTRHMTEGIPKISEIIWAKNPFMKTSSNLKTSLSSYMKSVHYVDHLLGNIMDALKTTNQFDSTAVFVISDHGMHFGDNFNHFGKWTLFDAALKVPLVVKPPNGFIDAEKIGTTVSNVVELVDLFPTMIEISGVQPPEIDGMKLDGQSLIPLVAPSKATLERTKNFAFSVLQTCTGYSSKRDLPCTTANRGGLRINGIGVSVRHAENRTTEWRKSTKSKSFCNNFNKRNRCNDNVNCIWLEVKIESSSEFHCIPNVAGYDGVDYDSTSGLIAVEIYDNECSQNMAPTQDLQTFIPDFLQTNIYK